MTDEQIIKALEYCCGNERTNDDECSSGKCYQVDLPESREDGTRWCSQWLMRDALELINRQKAEIERLKRKNTFLLKKKCKESRTATKIIKSEAIKEFAERLKEESYSNSDICGYTSTVVDVNSIDNLVKEMTEEKQ